MKYYIGSERVKVEDTYPFLFDSARKRKKRARKLEPYYDKYLMSVSTIDHTVSLKMAAFLHFFCEETEPRFILDLGSGFSSFVFAQYAKDRKCVVVSVDDQEVWLRQTKRFLEKHNIEEHRLVLWKDFQKMTVFPYDLIFNDFGTMESRRIHALRLAFPIMVETGADMILDDVHKPIYIKQVFNKVLRHPCCFYDLKDYTEDKLGRFAGLVRVDG